MKILKQAESGIAVTDLCRDHGMSSASFYKWRAKYVGQHGIGFMIYRMPEPALIRFVTNKWPLFIYFGFLANEFEPNL